MRPPANLTASATGLMLAGVLLAGCGVQLDAGSAKGATTGSASTASQLRARALRAASLPTRPAGELVIAGEQQGSLSSNAVKDYSAAQAQVRARYSAVGATEGFARLCRGDVDIVDSGRRISQAELAACTRNGIDIRTPIQIASDAIVLATRNESDVGGDCLAVDDVRDIYRRGSTIDNWRQLGFDDLALTATGPSDRDNAFASFASQVLGVASGATLDDLRSDYTPRMSDDAIRVEIAGADRIRRVPMLVERDVRAARRAQAGQRRAYVSTAVAAARGSVLRAISATNGYRARHKVAVGSPAALKRRNLRRVDVAKRRAAARATKHFDARFDVLRADRTRELLARARRTGVVGFVRFGYYEGYEDELRPLEIDPGAARDASIAAADQRVRDAGGTPPKRLPTTDADGNRTPNCVFPSQLTITTGEYPLSRPILLYTSTRGLRRAEVRGFLGYALRNAQQLATRSRFVPITDRLRDDQYKFVTGKALTAAAVGRQATTTAVPVQPARGAATSRTPASETANGSQGARRNSVPGVSSGDATGVEASP